jgi:hypothetical protein
VEKKEKKKKKKKKKVKGKQTTWHGGEGWLTREDDGMLEVETVEVGCGRVGGIAGIGSWKRKEKKSLVEGQ